MKSYIDSQFVLLDFMKLLKDALKYPDDNFDSEQLVRTVEKRTLH